MEQVSLSPDGAETADRSGRFSCHLRFSFAVHKNICCFKGIPVEIKFRVEEMSLNRREVSQ